MAEPSARDAVDALLGAGLTVATGESLTAGLVAATLADIPGCSAALRGGIVAYHVDVKASLLGVPETAIEAGVVTRAVAEAMAAGAARVLGADVGIGTTGVAGPEPHDGEPPGTVWIAVHGPRGVQSRRLDVAGDRAEVRRQAVAACWSLVVAQCGE